MAQRYRLKLSSLKFISPVDAPAQETALAVLMKRKDAPGLQGTARVVKLADDLGLVFCWALTTKTAGADYFDLHGDNVIEDDLIRVAAEFMESGGLTDEMHDRDPDGKVVFCMPLTAEVAKAFGVKTETEGLMIALRPSPEVFAKYKSGEYVGVSIDGTGERELIKAKVAKHTLYTNEVDGHQHTVSVYENGELYTSHNTATGAEYGHTHAVTRGADGSLVILADSGHSHELAEGQPAVVVVAPDAIVVQMSRVIPGVTDGRLAAALAARELAARKSTQQPAVPHGGFIQEGTMSNTPDLAKTVADLTKQLEQANKLATLTDAQRAYFKSKTGADADAFLAKSHDERESVLGDIEKGNPIVYTAKSGRTFRKSEETSDLCVMSKQLDAQTEALAKRDEAIEKQEIAKIAADVLAGVAGDDETHAYIVKSIRKGGGDAAMVEKALATLRSSKEFTKAAAVAKGFGGTDPVAGSPQAEIDTLVAAEMAKGVDKAKATVAVMNTTKGQQLYAEVQKAKKSARA